MSLQVWNRTSKAFQEHWPSDTVPVTVDMDNPSNTDHFSSYLAGDGGQVITMQKRCAERFHDTPSAILQKHIHIVVQFFPG